MQSMTSLPIQKRASYCFICVTFKTSDNVTFRNNLFEKLKLTLLVGPDLFMDFCVYSKIITNL